MDFVKIQGNNWACSQDASNMDPTTIAPNCWDSDSCNALSTSNFDNNFALFHTTPYTYVADAGFALSGNGINMSSPGSESLSEFIDAYVDTNGTATCKESFPACGLQTTIQQGNDPTCAQCQTYFRYACARARAREHLGGDRLCVSRRARSGARSRARTLTV